MSTKRNSTISAKPQAPSIEDWIGGTATENTPADKQDNQQANKSASKQVSKQTSQQTNVAKEPEQTAMFSVRVPSSLIRKLRIRAAMEGRPIQEIVAELLRDYLGDD